jgi:putrescine aminotransferase
MLRQICDRYGVLLIADEVLTGFGRTGKMFALEHWNVVPDLMTFAKGVTSGYFPMGGVMARREIADVFTGSERVMLRHVLTYGGQPAGCVAALKNLEILEAERLVENSATMGEYLLDGLLELQLKHSIMGDVQGKGLLVGVELVKDRITKERWPAEANLADRVSQLYKEEGVLLPMSSDVIRIAPPLCITRSEIDEVLRVTDSVLQRVEQELGATS